MEDYVGKKFDWFCSKCQEDVVAEVYSKQQDLADPSFEAYRARYTCPSCGYDFDFLIRCNCIEEKLR